ncbi:hypothetical protein [Micromonospora sp. I033]
MSGLDGRLVECDLAEHPVDGTVPEDAIELGPHPRLPGHPLTLPGG